MLERALHLSPVSVLHRLHHPDVHEPRSRDERLHVDAGEVVAAGRVRHLLHHLYIAPLKRALLLISSCPGVCLLLSQHTKNLDLGGGLDEVGVDLQLHVHEFIEAFQAGNCAELARQVAPSEQVLESLPEGLHVFSQVLVPQLLPHFLELPRGHGQVLQSALHVLRRWREFGIVALYEVQCAHHWEGLPAALAVRHHQ